jgi:HK97 family phage portal protein
MGSDLMPTVSERIRAALKGLALPFPTTGLSLFGAAYGSGLVSYANSAIDYGQAAGDLRLSSIIMACTNWKARTFPEAPLRVMRAGAAGSEAVPDHAMTALIRTPNPYYGGLLLWSATIADLDIAGNAYWLKIRDGGNRVRELWWEPSTTIRARWPVDGSVFISHYEVKRSGEWYPLPPEDVVHYRYQIDPLNPRYGLSPLAPGLREVFTDNEAAAFTAALLRNSGVPGVVLSPADANANPTTEQLQEVKDAYTRSFGGDHRGDVMVMRGATKVDTIAWSPEQLNMRTTRTIPEERIAALLGVPPMVVGLGAGLTRSTFSNMAEAREAAYESTLLPLQRLLSAELDTQLLPEFSRGGEFTDFDLSHVRVLQPDEDSKATRLSTIYTSGIITQNEARVALGWDAVPAGDFFRAANPAAAVPAPVA